MLTRIRIALLFFRPTASASSRLDASEALSPLRKQRPRWILTVSERPCPSVQPFPAWATFIPRVDMISVAFAFAFFAFANASARLPSLNAWLASSHALLTSSRPLFPLSYFALSRFFGIFLLLG